MCYAHYDLTYKMKECESVKAAVLPRRGCSVKLANALSTVGPYV